VSAAEEILRRHIERQHELGESAARTTAKLAQINLRMIFEHGLASLPQKKVDDVVDATRSEAIRQSVAGVVDEIEHPIA